MGFEPSRHDADAWMKEGPHRNDYVATNVDDLAVVAKDPKACMTELSSLFNLKT